MFCLESLLFNLAHACRTMRQPQLYTSTVQTSPVHKTFCRMFKHCCHLFVCLIIMVTFFKRHLFEHLSNTLRDCLFMHQRRVYCNHVVNPQRSFFLMRLFEARASTHQTVATQHFSQNVVWAATVPQILSTCQTHTSLSY